MRRGVPGSAVAWGGFSGGTARGARGSVPAGAAQRSFPTGVRTFVSAPPSRRAQRDERGREMTSTGAAGVPAGSRYATSIGSDTIPLAPGTATPTARPNGRLLVYPTAFHLA